jgi:CubicO group peptidase (beta-lactamase class C family)
MMDPDLDPLCGRRSGFTDPARVDMPVGRGTYPWDGAWGVWFWIDPERQLVYVGMIQRMMQEGMAPFQAPTQKLMAEAYID